MSQSLRANFDVPFRTHTHGFLDSMLLGTCEPKESERLKTTRLDHVLMMQCPTEREESPDKADQNLFTQPTKSADELPAISLSKPKSQNSQKLDLTHSARTRTGTLKVEKRRTYMKTSTLSPIGDNNNSAIKEEDQTLKESGTPSMRLMQSAGLSEESIGYNPALMF